MGKKTIVLLDLPSRTKITRSEMREVFGGKKKKKPVTQCWVIPGPDTSLAPFWYCYDEANDEWYMA